MKPKLPKPKLNRQILDEASDWFVDFRVGDVDAGARERFDEWLRRSPEHIRAYWEIAKTYVELPSSSDTGKLDVGALIAFAHSERNVVPFNAGTPPQEPRAITEPPPRAGTVLHPRAWRRHFVAAAACAILATLAVAFWWQTERYPLYSTDVGERRSLTLTDGSTVDLNARSSIRVAFTKGERYVELLDGQALFQVAKNPARPFIVRSAEATVRAVGTQFDVNHKPSGTTVTVLEGRVAVYASTHAQGAASPNPPLPSDSAPPPGKAAASTTATPQHQAIALNSHTSSGSAPALPAPPAGLTDPSGAAPVFLSAGEQVTVTPEAVPEPQHADLTATTAWMQRRLTFDGSKLLDVVAEFNRYNHRQLVIEGKELSDFHVSGVYSSTDPTSLLRFLREQPGIRIIETDSEVRIERD